MTVSLSVVLKCVIRGYAWFAAAIFRSDWKAAQIEFNTLWKANGLVQDGSFLKSMLINVAWYLSAVEMSFSCLYIFITYLHGIVNNTTTGLLAGFWSVLHSRGRIPCELCERGGAKKLVGYLVKERKDLFKNLSKNRRYFKEWFFVSVVNTDVMLPTLKQK